MFVRVDEDVYDPIQGFMYADKEGCMESVALGENVVYVADAAGSQVCVFNEDIPKLIKALQAAYDHIQKGK